MNENSERLFKIDNRFFVMYYSMIIVLISNSILYFYTYDSASPCLIVGMILVISLIMLSLTIILSQQNCMINGITSKLLFIFLYFTTGLVIIFADPNLIMLFSSKVVQNLLPNFYILFVYINIGAKNLAVSRKYFYGISYFITSLYAGFGIYFGKFVPNTILFYFFLVVFIFYKGNDIRKEKLNYKIIMTEGDPITERNEEAKTPLDEIVFEIKKGIDGFEQVCKRSSPKIQKIYTKIRKLLEKILKKLQSTNIYSSRLDLVTKNMDPENKLYIEQGFFDSYGSSMIYKPENITPKKIIEYDLKELASVLRKIEKEWNFDTFFVAGCSNAPIRVIGEFIFKRYGIDDLFEIPESILKSFLMTLERNYLDNPYHNSTHAADVLCSFLYIINASELRKVMNGLEWFGGIIACLAHDVGHPAKNNRYLIMTKNEYAIMYNDISVLEMMHTSLLFKLLQATDNNIFLNLTIEKFAQIRKLIIDMILATDMGKHFDFVSYTRAKYSENIDLTSSDARVDLFKLIIKAADVGHAAKSLELHQKWCNLVIEEFYTQGDLEKEQGIAVSMFCDRDNTNIGKAQSGFIKNIVLILYETVLLIAVNDDIEKVCIRQLKSNLKYWEGYHASRIGSSTEKEDNNTNILSIASRNDRRSL